MSYSSDYEEKTFRKKVTVKTSRESRLITVCAGIPGIPIFDGGGYEYKTQYEYKDRLSSSDSVYDWQRKDDGCWYEYVDGYWSSEDYGNPDVPPRKYREALKYRTSSSSLYSLDDDPNYTEAQKKEMRHQEKAEELVMAFTLVIAMAIPLVIAIIGMICIHAVLF